VLYAAEISAAQRAREDEMEEQAERTISALARRMK
jgi:hypothetical protein